jgi:uncharacterized protein YjbI with pentapeptide repeats
MTERSTPYDPESEVADAAACAFFVRVDHDDVLRDSESASDEGDRPDTLATKRDGEWVIECHRETPEGAHFCVFHQLPPGRAVPDVYEDCEREPGVRELDDTAVAQLFRQSVVDELGEGDDDLPPCDVLRGANGGLNHDQRARHQNQFVGVQFGDLILRNDGLDPDDRYPIDMRCCRVERLDWTEAQVGNDLRFVGAEVETTIFRGVKSNSMVILEESTIHNRAEFRGATIDGCINLDGATVGDINLAGGDVGGVKLDEVTVTGDINFSRHLNLPKSNAPVMTVNGKIDLKRATVKGKVNLTGVTVSGQVNISEATIKDKVNLKAATVDGQINLSGATVNAGVNLREAIVNDSINFSFAQICGSLPNRPVAVMFKDSTIDGDIILRYLFIDNGIIFSEATIGGEVYFKNITVGGAVDLSGVSVEEKIIFRRIAIKIPEISTKGKIPYLKDSANSGVDLSGATVSNRVVLAYAAIDDGVNLTDATVSDGVNIKLTNINGGVYFSKANIKEDGIDINRTTIEGRINISETYIGDGGINMRNITVGETVSVHNSDIGGTLRFVNTSLAESVKIIFSDIKNINILCNKNVSRRSYVGDNGLNLGTRMSNGGVTGVIQLEDSDIERVGIQSDVLGHTGVRAISLNGTTLGSDYKGSDGGLNFNHENIASDKPGRSSYETADPETRGVVFDLHDASVGNVSLTGPRGRPFEYHRFRETTFDGFEFSRNRERFRETSWRLHGTRLNGLRDIAAAKQFDDGDDDPTAPALADVIVDVLRPWNGVDTPLTVGTDGSGHVDASALRSLCQKLSEHGDNSETLSPHEWRRLLTGPTEFHHEAERYRDPVSWTRWEQLARSLLSLSDRIEPNGDVTGERSTVLGFLTNSESQIDRPSRVFDGALSYRVRTGSSPFAAARRALSEYWRVASVFESRWFGRSDGRWLRQFNGTELAKTVISELLAFTDSPSELQTFADEVRDSEREPSDLVAACRDAAVDALEPHYDGADPIGEYVTDRRDFWLAVASLADALVRSDEDETEWSLVRAVYRSARVSGDTGQGESGGVDDDRLPDGSEAVPPELGGSRADDETTAPAGSRPDDAADAAGRSNGSGVSSKPRETDASVGDRRPEAVETARTPPDGPSGSGTDRNTATTDGTPVESPYRVSDAASPDGGRVYLPETDVDPRSDEVDPADLVPDALAEAAVWRMHLEAWIARTRGVQLNAASGRGSEDSDTGGTEHAPSETEPTDDESDERVETDDGAMDRWEIDDDQSQQRAPFPSEELVGTPDQLESTYVKAKRGAKQQGDQVAAGQFFIRERKFAREQQWRRVVGSAEGEMTGDEQSRIRRTIHRITNGVTNGLGAVRHSPVAMKNWVGNFLLWLGTGYGEKPQRVLAAAVLVISGFAITYGLLHDPSNPLPYETPGIKYVVLSIGSFVTVFPPGDAQGSLSTWMNLLIEIEGFLGVCFAALFVFTLTRSVQR